MNLPPLERRFALILFYLYILSVVISIIFTYVIMELIFEKLRESNIKIVQRLSLGEEVKEGIGMIFKICFPIFNLLYVFYLIVFHSVIYEKFVTKLFLDGNAIFDYH